MASKRMQQLLGSTSLTEKWRARTEAKVQERLSRMSTAELKLWAEREFAQAFAAFDDVVHHGARADRLLEHMDTAHAMVIELARREL